MTRIDWIDTAKGFTIILVVMMHATLGVAMMMPQPNFMIAFVDFAQPFRIPAFFMMSGLLLARAVDRPWRTYLDSKVVHFIYFYALWLTIQFAFKAYGLSEKIGWHETLEAYVVSYIQPFGTLWFIYLLPVFFVATKLLSPLP
ncbi:MAG: acyltransferase family protein, partial [Pseudomonadota bacterium]